MRGRFVSEFPVHPAAARPGANVFTIGAVEQLAQQLRDRGDADIAPGVVLRGAKTEISQAHVAEGFVELIYTVDADEPFDALLGVDLAGLSIGNT